MICRLGLTTAVPLDGRHDGPPRQQPLVSAGHRLFRVEHPRVSRMYRAGNCTQVSRFLRAIRSAWSMRFILTLTLVIMFLLVDTRGTFACSCAPPLSPNEALERSSRVFAGTVVATYRANERLPVKDGKFVAKEAGEFVVKEGIVYEFRVSSVWKGPLFETVFISRLLLENVCSTSFEERRKYLVYGYGGFCTRTGLFVYSEEDLAALGKGEAPIPGSIGTMPDVVKKISVPAAFGQDRASNRASTPIPTGAMQRSELTDSLPRPSEEQEHQVWPKIVSFVVIAIGLIVLAALFRRVVIRRKGV